MMRKVKNAAITLLLNFWLVPFVGIIVLIAKLAN
jgi:hypothetical protein